MAKKIVTLTEGKTYWVLGQDFKVNEPKEFDDKSDKDFLEYVESLPNFTVAAKTKQKLDKDESPKE